MILTQGRCIDARPLHSNGDETVRDAGLTQRLGATRGRIGTLTSFTLYCKADQETTRQELHPPLLSLELTISARNVRALLSE